MENAIVEAAYRSLSQHDLSPLCNALSAVTGHSRLVYSEYNAADTNPYRFSTFGIAPEEYEDYLARYHRDNLWLQTRLREGRADQVYVGSHHITDSVLRRSVWYSDFMKPRDMADVVAIGASAPGSRHAFLSLVSSANQPHFENADIEQIRAVSPHLQRVLSIHQSHLDLSLETLFLRRVGDSRQAAHLLLDRQGRLRLITPAAEALLQQADGIMAHNNRLHFSYEGTDMLFQTLLQQTFSALLGEAAPPQPMRVQRPSAGCPYVIDICPWTVRNEGALASGDYALVTLFNADGRIGLRPELIKTAYKLTRCETRLVADLVDGLSVKQISASRNITLATLRNHLKSVYAKTGIHRQGELVSEMAKFLAE